LKFANSLPQQVDDSVFILIPIPIFLFRFGFSDFLPFQLLLLRLQLSCGCLSEMGFGLRFTCKTHLHVKSSSHSNKIASNKETNNFGKQKV